MATFDAEIDRLYQLPLAEFTSARDALAKRAGTEGADVRRLQKPNLAAWAVNQIYWRRRQTFERLTSASRRLRAAHAQHLSGKATDVAAAETAHRSALGTAADAASDLLVQAGDSATPATMQAVTETLGALLWTSLDGRLTRPLKPTGLEALAALKQRDVKAPTRAADVVQFTPAARRTPETKGDQMKREAHARRREIAEVERQLRAARTSDREADVGLVRARKAVEGADRERARLAADLEQATTRAQTLRDAVDKARRRAEQAAAERTRLDERLAWLRS